MLQPIIPYQPKISPYIIPGLKGRRTKTTEDVILNAVCNFYDIVFDVLTKKSRKMKIVEPRHVAMYLLCHYTSMSLKQIGELLGGFDHTTVIHAKNQINDLLCTDERLAERIMEIKSKAEIQDRVPNRKTINL